MRLESRPPLSIAPSGTSLIRRSRTDSSSFSSSALRPLLSLRAGAVAGAGNVQYGSTRHGSAVDDEPVAGRELRDPGERGARRREVAEREVGVDCVVVELGRDEPAREDALQLRREHDHVARASPVQRLDTKPVARDDAGAAVRVPDGNRELAAEPLGEGGAVLLEQVRQDLGVAARCEPVAVPLEVARMSTWL